MFRGYNSLASLRIKNTLGRAVAWKSGNLPPMRMKRGVGKSLSQLTNKDGFLRNT